MQSIQWMQDVSIFISHSFFYDLFFIVIVKMGEKYPPWKYVDR